ncbi:cytochrome c biogenesis protein CcsA [Lewinella cohaerens]|uniref:cytochrome c biogenesis protein CcsA n=1 Tax=Lewinella cohaerens TaxID=70995 RepID=UPI00036989EC|nr:cytochrome c biogenesis protein CcsA [Lewinella cohaerens]
MEKLIRQYWWKALGVLILLYVFVVGMLVPLKPGITLVAPSSAKTGQELILEIEGYNTNFDKAEDTLRMWLKMDNERSLAAKSIDVIGPRNARVAFNIPDYLPSSQRVQDFALVIDNPIDGASVRPNAVLITQDSIDPDQGIQQWVNENMTGLHEKQGITFPFRNILGETIRNTYFHVSLWLAMMIIFIAAMVYSIKYLRRLDNRYDYWASALTSVGLLLGGLGLLTGAIWAEYTWGKFWSWDIKQFTTLIALLIYMAYFVLRSAFPDEAQRARISAVYNIFAFIALIPLIYVLPRLTDSLHPGNGGNPALGGEDLDNTMRMVFYPAVIGWTLVSSWIASLLYRTSQIEEYLWDKWDEDDNYEK